MASFKDTKFVVRPETLGDKVVIDLTKVIYEKVGKAVVEELSGSLAKEADINVELTIRIDPDVSAEREYVGPRVTARVTNVTKTMSFARTYVRTQPNLGDVTTSEYELQPLAETLEL